MGASHQFIVIIQAAAAFGLVLTLSWLGVLFWARKRHSEKSTIAQRLGTSAADVPGESRALRLWHDGKEAITYVAGAARRAPLRVRFERLCRDAGFQVQPRTVATALVVSALVFGLILGLVASRIFPAFVGGLAVFLGFWAWVNKRVAKRARIFERQLVESLELSARALRAGHPLMASFQLISVEIPAPVGHLFAGSSRPWACASTRRCAAPPPKAAARTSTCSPRP
jgi:tight adherence protein B